MRRIPDKIRHGDTPSRVPRAVNDIIDYLRQTVPVPGTGIRISETINGNVFDADRPPQTVGGSGGAPAGYSGYFKVIDASELDEFGAIIAHKVKIVNGAAPDDADCGDTDLGTVAAQEVAYTLPAASARHHVYLRAKYATGTYSFDFIVGDDSAKPVTPYGYFVLADVDSKGSVTQVWQGGFIYWASRYYT